MGFVKCNCPNCGATIDFDDSREFGFCSFCGTKIVQDKVVVEHKGSVSLDRSAEINNLLIRAQEMIDKSSYREAEAYYNRVLDIDTNNDIARKGVNLCNRLINEPNLILTRVKSKTFNNNAAMDIYVDGDHKVNLRVGQSISLIETVGLHQIDVRMAGGMKNAPFQFTINKRLENNHFNLQAKSMGQVEFTAANDETSAKLPKNKKKKRPGCLFAFIIISIVFLFLVLIIGSGDSSDTPTNNSDVAQSSDHSQESNKLIYEDDYIKANFIKVYSDAVVDASVEGVVYLQLLVENKSEQALTVALSKAAVNGMSTTIGSGVPMTILPDNSSQQPFIIFTKNTNVKNADDIEKLQFSFYLMNDNASKVKETKTISFDVK